MGEHCISMLKLAMSSIAKLLTPAAIGIQNHAEVPKCFKAVVRVRVLVGTYNLSIFSQGLLYLPY